MTVGVNDMRESGKHIVATEAQGVLDAGVPL
jgi:hypothetical protein